MLNELLKESERLYRLGFGIHWLKPKSKMPVHAGWTRGPRKEWVDLKKEYRAEWNVGVRLGQASKLPGGYLGVIDCDVKSPDPKHQKEMLVALVRLFPDATRAPIVKSGRGNGSRHIYVLTPEPGTPQRLTQSPDIVEVLMPSVKASKRDLEALGAKRTGEGWRLRPAWEISFMGEGQQVVIPPSTHPDTGRSYVWSKNRAFVKSAPLFTGVNSKAPKPTVTDRKDFKFKPVEVELESIRIDARDRELIETGADCSDRSAGLFIAAQALVKAGLGENEILSVLTDKNYFLGGAAFEHAQTDDRGRAALWVKRYTFDKAHREAAVEEDFKDEVVVTELKPHEIEAQQKELEPEDWTELIERNQHNVPKNTLKNVILILQREVGFDVFKRDELAVTDIHGCDTPWGRKKGEVVNDAAIVDMKVFIAKKFRVEPGLDRLNEAVMYLANLNKFHPVKQYLDPLEWDGRERVDKFLETYFGAQGNIKYLRAVSRKILCAMVARIYEPGIKFDSILILEGKQGIGKSTAVRTLAGDAWFTDAHINVADKDSVMNIQGRWLIELGEIASMRKAEVDLLKAYISRMVDKIRVPYGKRTEQFPRQCVFIGTKNPDGAYLRDTTGNRRFWPVHIQRADFRSIAQDRDQLFAEAKILYEMGEALYLDDAEAEAGALEAQEERQVHDPLIEVAADFFHKLKELPEKDRNFPLDKFTMNQVLGEQGPFPTLTHSIADSMRAGHVLRVLGFEKKQTRVGPLVKKIWSHTKPEKLYGKTGKTDVWAVKGVSGHV